MEDKPIDGLNITHGSSFEYSYIKCSARNFVYV